MALTKLLEDFGDFQAGAFSIDDATAEAVEDQKLKSFEDGYSAGWDDAVNAQLGGGKALAETVRSSISATRLMQEDATIAFVGAIKPLFDSVLEQILPGLASASLAQHIKTLLDSSVLEATKIPIQIRVSPDQLNAVTLALKEHMPDTIAVSVDQTLNEGQASLTFADYEQQIDLTTLVAEIAQAVETFYYSVHEETKNA